MTKIKKHTTPSGYHIFPHHLLIGLREGVLTAAQIGAYMALVSLAEFTYSRPTYGTIDRTYDEIGRALHVDPATAFRWTKKLTSIGLLTTKRIPDSTGKVISCNYYWSFKPKAAVALAKINYTDWNDVISTLEEINRQISNRNVSDLQEIIAIVQSAVSAKTGHIFNTPLKIGLEKALGDEDIGRMYGVGEARPRPKDPNCPLCNPGIGKGDYCSNCQKDIEETFTKNSQTSF